MFFMRSFFNEKLGNSLFLLNNSICSIDDGYDFLNNNQAIEKIYESFELVAPYLKTQWW